MRTTRSHCRLSEKPRFWLFLLILLSFSIELQAQVSSKSRVPLRNGMTLSEVAAVWGEPEEVLDHEIRQQTFWSYPPLRYSPAITLRFVEGSLAISEQQQRDFFNNLAVSDKTSGVVSKVIRASEEPQIKTKPHSFMALEDHRMLTEILKEVPNAPDGPAGASPAAGLAAQSNPADFE